MKRIICRLLYPMFFCCCSLSGMAQAKLVINGGVIVIDNGAALVINNPDNAAIVRTGDGYIKSEKPANRVLWTIGAGNGNHYIVPFGNGASYLPLQFNAASGNGTGGYFIFSTYPTTTWKNSDDLPPGVTNINRGSSDNSASVIDRFWQINPQGYSTPPTLSSLAFSYTPAELAAPNTVNEARLIAQRWNTVLNSWADYIPPSLVNTAASTVTVPAIAGSQLYNWWTLVDMNAALPVTLTRFTATAGNKTVLTGWQTVLEQNADHFEVWRSNNGQQFELAGSVPAVGNGTGIHNYSYTDSQPYAGVSYYRLKSVDKNGSFSWSAIVTVTMRDAGYWVYPNPAHATISIYSNSQLLIHQPVVHLYDAGARLLQTFTLSQRNQVVNIAALPAGAYRFSIHSGNQLQTIPFIKN
jgi:Secretion system C-terminal sorting domain